MDGQIFYLGPDEIWNTQTPTPTGKKTAFDWLNAILNGATNILGGLFPGGLNNTGTGTTTTYPGQYQPTGGGTSSNNSTLIYVVIGVALLYFLTKDKK